MKEFNIRTVVALVEAWALKESAVCYLLQIDPIVHEEEQHFNQWSFLVVTSDVQRLCTHTDWVNHFGTPDRLYKASHGFCHVVKPNYGSHGSLSFVFVEISPKARLYKFQDAEELEDDLKLLVQKEVF